MPKSKRNKVMTLSKVKPKLKDHKIKEDKKIKEYILKYENIFVVKYQNINNKILSDLRNDFNDTKFVFSKHSLVKRIFQKNEKNKLKNTNLMTDFIKGETMIVFTNLDKNDFEMKINNIKVNEFAGPGNLVDYDIEIDVGNETFFNFNSCMDQYLRKLGVSCRVVDGKVHVEEKFLLCQKNVPLSSSQSKILKLLGIKLGLFKMDILCFYNKKNGDFLKYN